MAVVHGPNPSGGRQRRFLYRPGAGERKVAVAATKTMGGVCGRSRASEEPRDPMKFKNGDVRLDDAIKHNGGKLAMAKIPGLFELLRW